MVPEFGHFALILAFCLAIALTIVPLWGAHTGNRVMMASGRSMALGMFVFVGLSFACLVYAFVQDDFSVAYVANQSNSLLPLQYKVSAVWGGHEGSLLLWVLILSGWTLAVAIYSKDMPLDMVARVLSVMGMIAIGFCAFVLLTSNPFDRLLPNPPADGGDLNPLLQDFGLIIHPPMLYMGYVGFSVVFAFAIAALLSGRLDSAWARWSRPWTTVAWAFLTIGIALGSWWAYYELGWGGWWFWDPVENASFMPWLVGTALIHSLAVTEKRGVFKSWTLLLAIFAFSLSLLGTFLVRSGVLTSVHAFAADPERGVFILIFLALVVGGSLTLYAFRAPSVKAAASFEWLSREAFLLGNNVLLVVATGTILLGTLYPLIADALNWGKISVGPPYFDFFFIPLMVLLAVLLGSAALVNWKRGQLSTLKAWLLKPAVLSVALGALLPLVIADEYSISAALAITVGSWIVLATLTDIRYRLRNKKGWLKGFGQFSLSYKGMLLAHTGVAFTLLGASLNTIYSDHQDIRMEVGQRIEQGGYEYHFKSAEKLRGPNYLADRGVIEVYRNDKVIDVLHPEKRRYLSGGNLMTEVGINAGFWRDLYVALGEPLPDGAWAVRIHYKPFVRWIWLGAILMGLGGLLAVLDKRYRATAKATESLTNETVASQDPAAAEAR
ncbi:heme lyase CcmF/NrfE family subunit [Aestuariicella hydrocarbonica]|uniref:Heme lyase CcmF/NrfE family subunit n=1 Tax=Pseudomaricurvus hydrocarbonicus TaxID=1470433 RepID=A0A9E5MH44_9GAMM|nr:heme lyase CcmF/NrfE family subunit [Aestuariicella hydrocarbonica]NHO65496.1 heme lyase CcmF/NrfE family subunit [Aestuariicella hydrocarbonica]